MIKVKGTMIYPSKVDEFLATIPDVSSEYQIQIDHLNGRDILNLLFETPLTGAEERKNLEKIVEEQFKERIGMTPKPKAVGMGELPRSEKKSTRIFDNRY
jgi:phenylacetate-CoA ligase